MIEFYYRGHYIRPVSLMVHSLPHCLLTPNKMIIKANHRITPHERGWAEAAHRPQMQQRKELQRRRNGHISLPEARNTPGCFTPLKAMDEDITCARQPLKHILMSHKWWESCKQPGCEIASLASEFTLSAALGLSYFGHFLLLGW